MRAFIAIEIPPEIRDTLAQTSRELEKLPAEASWTRPGNIHLTLKFLGEVEEKRLDAIRVAMQACTQGIAPFSLRLGHLGAFPNLRRPRVLWAGLGGDVNVARELQKKLEEQLEKASFLREAKAFNPHLTLARLKSVSNPRAWAEAVDAYRLPPLVMDVSRIVLLRSELHPTGARYTRLAESVLEP